MCKSFFKRISIILFFIVFLLFAFPHDLPAQFKVYSWNNFEKGAFPQDLKRTNDATDNNVQVMNYRSPGMPGGIREGIAESECGGFGLQFQTGKTD